MYQAYDMWQNRFFPIIVSLKPKGTTFLSPLYPLYPSNLKENIKREINKLAKCSLEGIVNKTDSLVN